jgi:uncharacterized repeat protein (TIGR02543 family)
MHDTKLLVKPLALCLGHLKAYELTYLHRKKRENSNESSLFCFLGVDAERILCYNPYYKSSKQEEQMKRILVLTVAALALVFASCANPNIDSPASVAKYTVFYAANGASGSVPSASEYAVNDMVVVASNGSLSKTAYSFTGWNTKADGSGDSYAPSATFTMPASNVTLYAQWTAVPRYRIAYDANGGSGAPTDGTGYLANSNAIILATVPTKADNFFLGWTIASDNSGTVLKSGDSIAIGSSNVTLYAKWSPKKFSMKLYQGGIVNGLDSHGNPITEDLYRFTLVGYGEKTGGNFVVTTFDGTVYTGTFEYVDGPVTTTNISLKVDAWHYKFVLANGDSVTVPFKKIMDKASGAFLRYKTDTYYVASSDAMTATMTTLYGARSTFGDTLTPLEFAEF